MRNATLTTSGYTSRRKSGSIEIANRLTDTITDCCAVLGSFPYIGRPRAYDFGPGYRSLAVGEYVIVYCVENEDALILRVVHGRRELEQLFGTREKPAQFFPITSVARRPSTKLILAPLNRLQIMQA